MTILKFQKLILDWHKENRRNMPWRETKDPYNILVSEVMLQQTQVARVLPKYQEFLQAFPTLKSLALAQDRKLLRVWQGLGYWKRALSLKKTAKKIIKDHKEKFPQSPSDLQKLPGIGPYTANAIACFAFQNNNAFIDTNIQRVYLHFFFPKRKNVSTKEILKIAEKAVLKKNAREWHYALYDYGATVLKDKKINRQSKHYTKQSKFKGSFRAFRTSIMRFLLDQPKQTATISKIQRLLKKARSPYMPEKLLASLAKDDLIKKKRNSYSL